LSATAWRSYFVSAEDELSAMPGAEVFRREVLPEAVPFVLILDEVVVGDGIGDLGHG
jgi:hypothetical protein